MLLVILAAGHSKVCPPNRADFVSLASLSENDISLALSSLPNIIVQDVSDSNLTISNFSVTLEDNSGRIRADVPWPDQLRVQGHSLELQYTFSWSSKSGLKGYASGSTYSNSLDYTKQLVLDKDSRLSWFLLTLNSIEASHMPITKLSTGNATTRQALQTLLNNKGPRTSYLAQLNSLFFSTLRTALSQTSVRDFSRVVIGNRTLELSDSIWQADLESSRQFAAFKYFSNVSQKDICQSQVPKEPLSTIVYGFHQQFISLQLYRNILEELGRTKGLDFKLDNNTRSPVFGFFAGDLTYAIPTLNKQLSPKELIEASCAFKSVQQFGRLNQTHLKSLIYFDCQLGFKDDILLRFILQLTVTARLTLTQEGHNFIANYESGIVLSGGKYYMTTDQKLFAWLAGSLCQVKSGQLVFDRSIQSVGYSGAIVREDYVLLYGR